MKILNFKFQIPNLKSQSGFSLVEALLAVTVLLIAVLAIIQLFPLGLSMSRLSKNETIATNLVQGKLEGVKAVLYDDLASETRTKVSTDPNSPFYDFEGETSVEYVDSSLNSSAADLGLKKIVVTIFWQEKNKEKTVSGAYLKHE